MDFIPQQGSSAKCYELQKSHSSVELCSMLHIDNITGSDNTIACYLYSCIQLLAPTDKVSGKMKEQVLCLFKKFKPTLTR